METRANSTVVRYYSKNNSIFPGNKNLWSYLSEAQKSVCSRRHLWSPDSLQHGVRRLPACSTLHPPNPRYKVLGCSCWTCNCHPQGGHRTLNKNRGGPLSSGRRCILPHRGHMPREQILNVCSMSNDTYFHLTGAELQQLKLWLQLWGMWKERANNIFAISKIICLCKSNGCILNTRQLSWGKWVQITSQINYPLNLLDAFQ